jgi:hypothetical protein
MKKIILFMLGFLFITVSCEKNTDIGDGISLNEIPSDASYLKLPLIGTEWKLIGFVQSNNTIKMAEPDSKQCYHLHLHADGTITGMSSTNELFGSYGFNFQSSTIEIVNLGGTKINELFDGKLYMENLRTVQSYSISKKGLALYYDNNKNYLLFKPSEP